LGIGLALRGKASKAERFLIMVCSAASAGMNFAAANAASWRSVVAYTAAPIFLAIITDRVISVIRRHVLPFDTESAWAWLGLFTVRCLKLSGIVVLYGLRTMLAPKSTFSGLRRMVLDAAPVPGLIEPGPVLEEPALPEPAEALALPVASCHIWVPSTGRPAATRSPAPSTRSAAWPPALTRSWRPRASWPTAPTTRARRTCLRCPISPPRRRLS
jgi:hypothetical protein